MKVESSGIIPRIFDSRLGESLRGSSISVLLGPRQTGKTTSISEFLNKIPVGRKLTISLDSSFERQRIQEQEFYLQEKIEETLGFPLESLRDRFYLFLDEAQKLPAVFESVKMLYDRHKRSLKIILSGSSSLELLDHSAETLAGRVQTTRVFPFSMSEASLHSGLGNGKGAQAFFDHLFAGTFNREWIEDLIKRWKPTANKKLKLVDSLMTRSLFPPTFSRIAEEEIPRWLMDYCDTYVERDMRSVRDIGNIDGYRRLVAQLSSRTGGLLEYHQLGVDSGLNQITAKKYVAIWQESLIGTLLSPFLVNLSTRVKKSRKVFFCDNGLVWALSGFQERKVIEASGAIGHYLENLIVADFIKWGATQTTPPAFYFWEKSQASEMDLVVQSRGNLIPVQIKNTRQWEDRFLHGFSQFLEKHKRKGLTIPFCLFLYNGDFQMPAANVFCVPVWALC